MDQETIRGYSDQATQVLLNKQGTASSTSGGWMMISTILIEAWDLYAIAFVLLFISDSFHPGPWEAGLIGAAVQAGAIFGAFFGGYIADKLGRKAVFIGTMVLFIILAIAQAFVQDVWQLILVRFLLGIPLGSDISNGYAYIMESMPKGQREIMGSRWQFMFGAGEVISLIIIVGLYLTGMNHETLWRLALALGALPAVFLLIGRFSLPETPLSLLQRGKFVEAKQVSQRLFGDSLAMLPNQDVTIERPKVGDFLKVIWADPIKKRAATFGWVSNILQGLEFAAWGFYIPVIFATAGIGDPQHNMVANYLATALIFCLATVSGYVAPLMLPKIGHRGVSMAGFGMAFIALIIGGFALTYHLNLLLIAAAALLMWGHYWDASNGMTISSMVAPPRFKGTASGFAYMFVKAAVFIGIYIFPWVTSKLGPANTTFAVSIISALGVLSAYFILPEMYGYVETEAAGATAQATKLATAE
ncbi:MAG: MFS transporter [Hyphomicrobiales bacterium]|nr:MFS transporter [Hyphomicrobiales bacterium]